MPLYGQRGYGQGRYGIADTGPLYKMPMGYYLNLFSSQYKGKSPKFLKWAQAAWTPIDNLTDCLAFMSGNFDLDVANGIQLDVLGLFVGAKRTLTFQPSMGVSPVLDDNTYRLYIRAKVAQNHWDGKLNSLYSIWKQLFPGGKLIINDNQNMTATVIVSGSFNSIIVDLIENGLIVPRPEGVEYNYVVGTDLPIFGTDLDNDYIAGVDKGHIS